MKLKGLEWDGLKEDPKYPGQTFTQSTTTKGNIRTNVAGLLLGKTQTEGRKTLHDLKSKFVWNDSPIIITTKLYYDKYNVVISQPVCDELNNIREQDYKELCSIFNNRNDIHGNPVTKDSIAYIPVEYITVISKQELKLVDRGSVLNYNYVIDGTIL